MFAKKYLNLITSLSDADFCAEAYADYLDDCASNYQNLINAAVKALDDDYDLDAAINQYITDHEMDESDESIAIATQAIITDETIIAQRAQVVLNEYNIHPDTPITLLSGYTNALDLIKRLISGSDDISCDVSGEKTLYNIELPVTDIEGRTLTASTNLMTAIDDMKSSLHSVVCMASCAYASKYQSITDRLQVYQDRITDAFSNYKADISGSFNHYKSMLQDVGNDVRAICNTIMDELNVTELIDELSNKYTVDSTDVAQYTGASPLPALDLKSAGSIVGTAITATAKVVGTAVASTIGGLWNKYIKPGIFKAVNKIKNIVDPYDLEVLDENATGQTVDGWCFQNESFWSPTNSFMNALNTKLGTSFTASNLMHSCFDAFKDKWVKFKLITGEILIRFGEIFHDQYNLAAVRYIIKFKPSVIKGSDLARKVMNASDNTKTISGSTSTSTGWDCDYIALHYSPSDSLVDNFDDIAVAIQDFKAKGDLYETITDTNEKEMYADLIWGSLLTQFFITASAMGAFKEMGWSTPQSYNIHAVDGTDGTSLIAPTNKEFLQCVSGWDGNTSSPTFSLSAGIDGAYGGTNSQDKVDLTPLWMLVPLILLQRTERITNPVDYPFMPYRNGLANFDPSKYKIKTDAENQNALTIFLTAVVVAVIVVAATISIGIAARKLARNKFWKRTEFIGKSDNLMWNGGKMTPKDRRKYLRYQRKLGINSTATSGLTSGVANILDTALNYSSANDVNDMSKISSLITGK